MHSKLSEKACTKCRHHLHPHVSHHTALAQVKAALKKQMEQELKNQKDPRMFGNGAVFDQYPYAEAATRSFYERYMKGEKMKAGWVNESDFEKPTN